MLSVMWLVWGLAVVTMVSGVALVSARRPPSHVRWGVILFCIGFVGSVAAISAILVAPMR